MRPVVKSVLSVILVALLLVACQGPTPAPASQPATSVPAAQPTTPPSAGSGEKITINFWHQESVDARVAVLQKLLDQFQKLNPNITVVQSTMTWDDQFVKLMSAVKAGNPPELLWGSDPTTITMQDVGALVPVTDLVESLDAEYSFVPAHRDALFWDGEYWGVPVFGLSYNFWYRKDLFKEANLEPPKTWDDVLAAAKALNAPSKQQWATVFPASSTLYADQVVASFLFSNGGDIVGPGNQLLLNSPEFIETLRFYSEVAKLAPPDNGNYTWPEAGQAFGQKKGAMLATFNAVLDWMSTGNTPDNLGIMPFPTNKGKPSRTIAYTLNVMMLTKDPAKQDAIKKLITFLLQPDNYGLWAAEFEPGLFLPISKAGLDSQAYWSHPKVAPYQAQIRTAMELTSANVHFGLVKGEKPSPGLGPLSNGHVLADAAQKVILGQMTPEQAAAWAQTKGIELLTSPTK